MGFPHYCAEPSCSEKITEGRYCPKHVKESPAALNRKKYDEVRADDPVRKWYSTARWSRFRDTILRLNPMCSRIEHGEQCTQPATVVHHLQSPRTNPELFLTPANVRAVCAGHHHGAEGEPGGPADWDKLYVKTRFEVRL